MPMETRLELRTQQRLVLTPQLQLAIKLLQIPQLELVQVLNQELTENPFLEESSDEVYNDEPHLEESPPAAVSDEGELPLEDFVHFGDVNEYFEERGSDGRDLGYFTPGVDEQPSYEMFHSRKTDLTDHLLWQLRLSPADDDVRRVAELVIGNIDGSGYLRITEEELGCHDGVGPELVRAAIDLVQGFDPPGVGARDLRECLLLQLRAMDLSGTLVEKIVLNNIEELKKKKYSQIARQYNSPIEDVMMAVRIIEGLEPRPAASFSSEEVAYIVPDVFIVRTEEEFKIVLNEEGMPRLRLNPAYKKLLKRKESLTKEEKQFLREKLRLAQELMKSLDQRNRTIYRVSDSILRFQRDFFERGVQHLRPSNLRDVAQDIQMHESTISRVTSNKYLACDHGVFSFRYFFSSAVQSDNGEVSSTSVKEMIRKIISAEEPRKPLSDQMIVEKLREANILIARRTVAKYREEMRIPPQNQRRKYE